MISLEDLTNFFLNSVAADDTLYDFKEIKFLEDKIVEGYDLSEEDLNILRDLPSYIVTGKQIGRASCRERV